jgi:aromatic-L-amino-acid/L-tryptophan decarboxylase
MAVYVYVVIFLFISLAIIVYRRTLKKDFKVLDLDDNLIPDMFENVNNILKKSFYSRHRYPQNKVSTNTISVVNRILKEEIPLTSSLSPDEKISSVITDIISHGNDDSNKGFMSFVAGGGNGWATVSSFIALALNRMSSYSWTSPAAAAIEQRITKWLCDDVIGYEETKSGGVLTSGGSQSNWIGVLLAKQHANITTDTSKGIIYCSNQIHHSVIKGAKLAGFPIENIRCICTQSHFQINTQFLEEVILKDISSGLQPFLIIGCAGSTHTGYADNLVSLALLSKKYNMWLHTDAAYGGFFNLLPSKRDVLKGINLSDSITLDPHKSFFSPFGTGAIVARDIGCLKKLFHTPHDIQTYMPDTERKEEKTIIHEKTSEEYLSDMVTDVADISPEQSRPFRALGLYIPLHVLGLKQFTNSLQEKIDQALYVYKKIQSLHVPETWSIEIIPPRLSILLFRLVSSNRILDLEAVNKKIVDIIVSRRNVLIYGTNLIPSKDFWVRLCFLNIRTHQKEVDTLVDDIQYALSKVV